MVEDFQAYERELGRRFLVPLLKGAGIDLTGKSVLDVGCGYGGVLAALAEAWPLGESLGVDLDPEMIAAGMKSMPAGVHLSVGDYFALEEKGYALVLMRDVLEHIVDVEGALAKASRLLAAEGSVYASFAPFFSPFGGHQHNGSGLFSRIPWVHVLPERWFRSLLRLPGNTYKTAAGLSTDIDTVLRTRLTLGRFHRAARKAGFSERHYAQHAVRPDYQVKFGIPSLVFPRLPGLDELVCTGAEALLVAGATGRA